MAKKSSKKSASSNIQPLGDRVLILPQAAEAKTASGIYLPDSAQEKPQYGTVVASGPGALTDTGERAALSVKAGDTVIYGKYAGTEIDVDGVAHMIMRESELLAVIEG